MLRKNLKVQHEHTEGSRFYLRSRTDMMEKFAKLQDKGFLYLAASEVETPDSSLADGLDFFFCFFLLVAFFLHKRLVLNDDK